MQINRKFCMPNKETFKIKGIRELIQKYISADKIWIDPFARNSIFNDWCVATNDLNPACETTHHLPAIDFLRSIESNSIDGVLFDPPYSPRQVKECYNSIGRKVEQKDTQSKFWADLKKEISRIVKKDGIVISCGWNSGGMCKCNGFEIQEILLINHGGPHNDTIVVVDKKIK